MKKTLAFSAVATLTVASLPAWAGGPMPQGTFTIGAERLMGVVHANTKEDPYPGDPTPPPPDEDSYTAFTLLGNGGGFAGDSRAILSIPRVGLDYFIIDGLSLGGSFTLLTVSHSRVGTPFDDSSTNLLFAPRVGYAYMFGDVVGIWPRGGISYMHGSFDPEPAGGSSDHFFALEIDVPFIFAPVKNFAITVGPLFDVTIGGSHTDRGRPVGQQTRDESLTMFGLSAGIVGIL